MVFTERDLWVAAVSIRQIATEVMRPRVVWVIQMRALRGDRLGPPPIPVHPVQLGTQEWEEMPDLVDTPDPTNTPALADTPDRLGVHLDRHRARDQYWGQDQCWGQDHHWVQDLFWV